MIWFDPGNPSIKEDRVVAFSRHRARNAGTCIQSAWPFAAQAKLIPKTRDLPGSLNLLEVVYWILNHQLRTVNLDIVKDLSALLFFSLFGWKRPEALPRWAKALACVLIGAWAVLIALKVYYGRAFFNHAMT